MGYKACMEPTTVSLRDLLDVGSYFKTNGKYKGYFTLPGHKRCKGSQWFEVEEVIDSTHPNPDTCFEGKVRIRKILPPKKIALSDRYPLYDDYLKDWHGNADPDQQGYHFNPKAKWDWYKLGGRWAGTFALTPDGHGQLGEKSWTNEDEPTKPHTVDQAMKKDIDFEQMAVNQFDEMSDVYDQFEEEMKKDDFSPTTGYFGFGIENTGDKDNYIPETRKEFLKRRAGFSTFAVIKDGEWYEKGEMGWFACVTDEKDPDEWTKQFNKLLDELPGDTLLSVYDCHI
jgi:hypothetical protein